MAGESKRNTGSRPWSARAAATASLRAKSTEAARNRGGSPTACFFLGNKLPHLATGLFWKVVGQRDCDDKWWLNDLGNNFGMWFI